MTDQDQWIIPDPTATTLIGHMGIITCVAISLDGKTVATGSQDLTIKLWELETGRLIETLSGHIGSIRAIAFSPDGKLLASVAQDRFLRIWSVAEARQVQICIQDGNKHAVTFSIGGSYVVFGTNTEIKILDLWTLDEVNTLRSSVQTDPIIALEYSPNGERLVSAGTSNEMVLWDTVNMVPLQTLASHSDWVRTVAFSPDGTRLASAGDEPFICIRPTNNPSNVLRRPHLDWVKKIAFSPDGDLLATLAHGKFRIFDSFTNLSTPKNTVEGLLDPDTFAVSADGRYVICSAGQSSDEAKMNRRFNCTLLDFRGPNFGRCNPLDEAFV